MSANDFYASVSTECGILIRSIIAQKSPAVICMQKMLLALLSLIGLPSTAVSGRGPSDHARIFEPGIISGPANELAPAFNSSAKTLYFTRTVGRIFTIMASRRQGRSWSQPGPTSFSGHWNDMEASLAPGGRYMIFASDRPATGETGSIRTSYYGREQIGGRLWRVAIQGTRFKVPRMLPGTINSGASVWTPSLAANNDLFFMRTDLQTGRFRLMAARARQNGDYDTPHTLAFSTGASNDVDPFIDPQQRFIIFSSVRAGPGIGPLPGAEHLFIAFAPNSDDPIICRIRIPGWLDSTASEVEARVSSNGHSLYFASRHPDHASGQAPSGNWDNGKSNIWIVSLQATLWQSDADSTCCKHAGW
jgi:hypothetical protein